jgi:hypothetical protein
MKQTWKFVVVVLFALCIGAGLDETLHVIRDQKTKVEDRSSHETFQQRLQCKSLADDYAKKNSENNSTLFLERVDFSPSRRSCVAAFTRWTTGKRGELHDYETIDIVSGETLFSAVCIENDPKATTFCGNGRDLRLDQERKKALEDALAKSE